MIAPQEGREAHMDHEAAKALAWRWIEAGVRGDGDTLRALLAPDCRLFIAGEMPFCGWMDVAGFFAQTAILALDGPIEFEVGEMIADGDRVWFEAQSRARLAGGAPYRNIYMFQLRFRNELIVEYKEFADTLHIWRTIDDPRTRGPAIPRPPFLSHVQRRFVGTSIGEAERTEAAP